MLVQSTSSAKCTFEHSFSLKCYFNAKCFLRTTKSFCANCSLSGKCSSSESVFLVQRADFVQSAYMDSVPIFCFFFFVFSYTWHFYFFPPILHLTRIVQRPQQGITRPHDDTLSTNRSRISTDMWLCMKATVIYIPCPVFSFAWFQTQK